MKTIWKIYVKMDVIAFLDLPCSLPLFYIVLCSNIFNECCHITYVVHWCFSLCFCEPSSVDSEGLVLLVFSIPSDSCILFRNFIFCGVPCALRGGNWWKHPTKSCVFQGISLCIKSDCGSVFFPHLLQDSGLSSL